ncbi:hypothetical protein AX15_000754 [Amanita polypyramis BW_CC]|nr:hypothetical protein AX15_000754 [Amanita polypyramis BW_CC]
MERTAVTKTEEAQLVGSGGAGELTMAAQEEAEDIMTDNQLTFVRMVSPTLYQSTAWRLLWSASDFPSKEPLWPVLLLIIFCLPQHLPTIAHSHMLSWGPITRTCYQGVNDQSPTVTILQKAFPPSQLFKERPPARPKAMTITPMRKKSTNGQSGLKAPATSDV